MMEQALAQRNCSLSRKADKSRQALTITHPNSAGIDIGSASHYVAVPPDRDDEPVREFASFTADLHRLADWLAACGVDTVAMESTGVYWIPLYELLDARGFTVLLVNARHVQHMQKALTQMNIQLTNVISDVAGDTGQKILRAIVAGERDGHVLAAMKNARIQASNDQIANSLHGNWRREHLFALQLYGTQLSQCDAELEAQL